MVSAMRKGSENVGDFTLMLVCMLSHAGVKHFVALCLVLEKFAAWCPEV